jgi:hypothetical protein
LPRNGGSGRHGNCKRAAEHGRRSGFRLRSVSQRESPETSRALVAARVAQRASDARHDGHSGLLGSNWNNSFFTSDKVTGLDDLYSHIGGSGYAHTNSEYYDGSGNVNTSSISKGSDITDTSATPSGAPSTSQVLAEVAKVTNNRPVANAYYPVYSDQPRGNAGYCAWHSSGTINGIQVQFGFFFNLDGDPGCDPGAPTTLGHSQGLSALANVSGHELSEVLTDPQLNAWYDQRGSENADKCAWTFNGLVTIGAQSWKIQGNWSNAAANTNSGYANGGCIQTS